MDMVITPVAVTGSTAPESFEYYNETGTLIYTAYLQHEMEIIVKFPCFDTCGKN